MPGTPNSELTIRRTQSRSDEFLKAVVKRLSKETCPACCLLAQLPKQHKVNRLITYSTTRFLFMRVANLVHACTTMLCTAGTK